MLDYVDYTRFILSKKASNYYDTPGGAQFLYNRAKQQLANGKINQEQYDARMAMLEGFQNKPKAYGSVSPNPMTLPKPEPVSSYSTASVPSSSPSPTYGPTQTESRNAPRFISEAPSVFPATPAFLNASISPSSSDSETTSVPPPTVSSIFNPSSDSYGREYLSKEYKRGKSLLNRGILNYADYLKHIEALQNYALAHGIQYDVDKMNSQYNMARLGKALEWNIKQRQNPNWLSNQDNVDTWYSTVPTNSMSDSEIDSVFSTLASNPAYSSYNPTLNELQQGIFSRRD